jgi:hypothetical protein
VAKATASQTTAKTSAPIQASAEQHAEIGGDALAALEAEPHGEEMAEEGAEAGDDGEVRPPSAGDEHRGGALQRVEQQGEGGEPLVAGAQHVGGADVAGADLAHVAEAGGARDQQAERDGAEQVAEGQGGKKCRHCRLPAGPSSDPS